METTFMTIHNISPEATILFCSESVTDVLGFQSHEVVGRSCFDYFHPDEVPFAKYQHARGIQLDRAAVLRYARIKSNENDWVGCECVFTVVYDVLVACTSIYRAGMERSQRATFDAPYVRRVFASSPLDPRYHMLQHLSPKFENAPPVEREPRAALVLNRFTRTMAVIFATDSVAAILGVTPDQLLNKSFYECIDEGCLAAALRCLESAKANDSIAYLRFWSRDPRRAEDIEGDGSASHSPSSEEGGVQLPSSQGSVPRQSHEPAASSSSEGAQGGTQSTGGARLGPGPSALSVDGRQSSQDSSGETDPDQDVAEAIFERAGSRSSTSSVAAAPEHIQLHAAVELEAVVSCTSDGLVVILRRARPMIPMTAQTIVEIQQGHGVFAAPWGAYPDAQARNAQNPARVGAGGPSIDNVMRSIRDVAVFAWSLVGINGNIAAHGQGFPVGEAMPPQGLPVWEPHIAASGAGSTLLHPPHNQAQEMWNPWSGRFGSQPQPQPRQPSNGRDNSSGYSLDDLAPSARQARAHMWQARHDDQGFAHPPPAVAPFPSMQQFNADADAGVKRRESGSPSDDMAS